jgi:hypothetical protein
MEAEGYWSYGHEVFKCSKGDDHTDECDGLCGTMVADSTVIDLHNEMIEWNKRGMVIQGVPNALSGGPFPGIGVEIFELECRLAGLINYLEEEARIEFDVERASEIYRGVMIDKLQSVRRKYDEAKAREDITVAKPQLLGPNGEVLH